MKTPSRSRIKIWGAPGGSLPGETPPDLRGDQRRGSKTWSEKLRKSQARKMKKRLDFCPAL